MSTGEQSTKVKPPAQPGLVLGPDGKPCKPCTAFRNWRPNTGGTKSAKSATPTASAAAAATTASASTASTPEAAPRANCPADVEELGRATWAFLHTTAAYYPDKPSVAQRANMLNLLHALPTLYPCSDCAGHFGEEVKKSPPDVGSRAGLSWWLCQQHNRVNERLGKELFDCKKTDERWRDGPADGRCD